MIPPHRIQFEKWPYYYPYRDTCAVDVLQNYKCEEGFSDEIKVCWVDRLVSQEMMQFNISCMQILFPECGDLRNTLKTVSSGIAKHFQLHLNHFSPTVLARNILILKIITSQEFDTKNEEDVAFLWDVWYNVDWPKQTQTRFKLVLKELMDNNLPENVTIAKDSQLEKFKAVWLSWWSAVCLNDLKIQSEKKSSWRLSRKKGSEADLLKNTCHQLLNINFLILSCVKLQVQIHCELLCHTRSFSVEVQRF